MKNDSNKRRVQRKYPKAKCGMIGHSFRVSLVPFPTEKYLSAATSWQYAYWEMLRYEKDNVITVKKRIRKSTTTYAI